MSVVVLSRLALKHWLFLWMLAVHKKKMQSSKLNIVNVREEVVYRVYVLVRVCVCLTWSERHLPFDI